MIVLIKTVSNTNSPLFCLSVIYIQKSLKRWEKYVFAVTEKISDLNSIYFHAKTILFWDYFFFSVFWFVKRHSFKPRALHFQLNYECDVTGRNFHPFLKFVHISWINRIIWKLIHLKLQ